MQHGRPYEKLSRHIIYWSAEPKNVENGCTSLNSCFFFSFAILFNEFGVKDWVDIAMQMR